MRIVLLADLHLVQKGQLTNDGYDVNAQFLKVVDRLKQEQFDHIIILGDICYKEGDYETYDWFFDEIENLNKPFDIIPGNHDSPELLIKILDQPTACTYDKQIYFTKELGGHPCLFLDTSAGKLTGKQLEWLKNKLFDNQRDLLIFMHHPPCNGGVPFMDSNHFLSNRREINRLLRLQDYNINVFTGHYHVDKKLSFNNCIVHICPSPFFTLDQSTIDFTILERTPCFQFLEIKDGIEIDTVFIED